MTTAPTFDFEAIKARQRATWSSGDYAVIGSALQITGERICETVDVAAGERVLDVAAGNGNAALAAARRGAIVTASDYVPTVLAGAVARAAAEGASIEPRVADAENLPFAAGSFDVVLSTFGVMFAPSQERAAAELTRVCKPAGRIGITAWTPDGFAGEILRVVGRYAPPPAGVRSPTEWGTRERVGSLFETANSIGVQCREFVFRYRSAEHWLDTFFRYYGPTHQALTALDAAEQVALARDLLALARTHNTATNGTFRAPSPYLETLVVTA